METQNEKVVETTSAATENAGRRVSVKMAIIVVLSLLLLIPIALSSATMMSDITTIFMISLLSIVFWGYGLLVIENGGGIYVQTCEYTSATIILFFQTSV